MRTQSRRRPPRATLAMAAAGTLLAPLLSGCWVGAGGSGSGGNSINVLMVNNPQMVELQKLTASHFTNVSGAKPPDVSVRGWPRACFGTTRVPVRPCRPEKPRSKRWRWHAEDARLASLIT
jgi:hypothetical protein